MPRFVSYYVARMRHRPISFFSNYLSEFSFTPIAVVGLLHYVWYSSVAPHFESVTFIYGILLLNTFKFHIHVITRRTDTTLGSHVTQLDI